MPPRSTGLEFYLRTSCRSRQSSSFRALLAWTHLKTSVEAWASSTRWLLAAGKDAQVL
jgi:hypothetical protein